MLGVRRVSTYYNDRGSARIMGSKFRVGLALKHGLKFFFGLDSKAGPLTRLSGWLDRMARPSGHQAAGSNSTTGLHGPSQADWAAPACGRRPSGTNGLQRPNWLA